LLEKTREAQARKDMSDPLNHAFPLPPEQQAIRDRCFHPSGTFVKFKRAAIEQSIPARFEQQVRNYPDRVAVKTRTHVMTYAELNHAANRVAEAILSRLGTGQEPIGLLLPKGVALIVTILGTLKAGKICMPMDPTLPHVRLSYILKDAQANLILTNKEYLGLANRLVPERQSLEIDESDRRVLANPDIDLAPDAYAFIFYTSGSTGDPKGVVENHRNLLHYVMVETNDYHICPEDRLTFLVPTGRDIFRAALNGASVYPVDINEEGLSGLVRWLLQEEITLFGAVPSVFRRLVSTLTGDEHFPHLRLIKLMGEPMHERDVELYRKHFATNCIFANSYGPNETGLIAHYLIDRDTQVKSSMVPVGNSVEDKEVLILDEDDKEIGIEQTGQIAVRSCYLSPGYWRRPDLTRAAFSRALSKGAKRFYRTGDMGVMQPDGCLMHLGRLDFQVKIRGNRVEIAEVEIALLGLDAIKEAVVVAREDIPGLKRLVAYIVTSITPAPTASALRTALAAKLPGYMIPSAFVSLEALPLIGLGKIDRRALPEPDYSRSRLETPYVGARRELEQQLVAMWEEILDVRPIGIHDNFFDLGGHSLTALQIISRVIEALKLELPVKALFESPTIAEMAEIIEQNRTKPASDVEIARMLGEVETMTDVEAEAAVKQLDREANS
jgi:amino acid adenylation domain-containing protein